MANLYVSADMNTGSSGLFRTTSYNLPQEMIPQTTLSNFMNGLNVKKVKLMKMDIEDFEYEAILGSKDLIT